MPFSFDQFYRLNRKYFIWVLFFAIIWLLRDFFSLIFLTFFFAFIAQPMAVFFQRWLRLPRRGAIVLAHVVFLCTAALVITLITPRVVSEAKLMVTSLPRVEARLIQYKDEAIKRYPSLEKALPGYLVGALGGEEREGRSGAGADYRQQYFDQLDAARVKLGLTEADVAADALTTDAQKLALLGQYDRQRDELLIKAVLGRLLDLLKSHLPAIIGTLYKIFNTLLLALVFSLLISMDLPRLEKDVRGLGLSRLRDFYDQTAQPVVRFAYIVGRAIRAQALIALANTFLTVIGLSILGIPSVAMLAFIVFFCSFIPVLGVFLSTLPIVLVALNSGGMSAAIGVMVMVVLIHLIEAYLLNPIVYGRHFKINPVLVLLILFIGHHAFGVWGMILGVPVTYYFMHDVLGMPVWDERKLSPAERGAGPIPAPDGLSLGALPRSQALDGKASQARPADAQKAKDPSDRP